MPIVWRLCLLSICVSIASAFVTVPSSFTAGLCCRLFSSASRVKAHVDRMSMPHSIVPQLQLKRRMQLIPPSKIVRCIPGSQNFHGSFARSTQQAPILQASLLDGMDLNTSPSPVDVFATKYRLAFILRRHPL